MHNLLEGVSGWRSRDVRWWLLFPCLSLCASAAALAPLQTISEPTERVWRDDFFDQDFVTDANPCPGMPLNFFYFDPTWTTYSAPSGVATVTTQTTAGIPPLSANEEMLINLGSAVFAAAFVDHSLQSPPSGGWPSVQNQGIYAKVTIGDPGGALLFLRLGYQSPNLPVSGYALEIDPLPPMVALRIYKVIPGAPAGAPPTFALLASDEMATTTTAEEVYHARFEVVGTAPATIQGSVWGLGVAERDNGQPPPLFMVSATDPSPYTSGFGGVGLQDVSGTSVALFDDIVYYQIGTSPITTTIHGFQGGGHFFAQTGNGNSDCPLGAGFSSANMWCTVACLHMMMDYWDNRANNPIFPVPMLPQEQIGHVANVNQVATAGPAEFLVFTGGPGNQPGTAIDDSRRALHFSGYAGNLAADGAVGPGYQGLRNLGPPGPSGLSTPPGYAARCSVDGGGWVTLSQAQGTPPSSAQKLRDFLDLGYPIILHIPPGTLWSPFGSEKEEIPANQPPPTEIGHSVLCIGYHLTDPASPGLNLFEFHDPWHGPNVWVDEITLFGADSGVTPVEPLTSPSSWYSAGGPYTWGGPWDVTGLPSGTFSGTFTVNPTVTYSDPVQQILTPGAGSVFTVGSSVAELTLGTFLGLTSGTNPQSLASIAGSLTSDSPSWSVDPLATGPGFVRCDAWGLLQPGPSSSSYPSPPGYQDEIWGYNWTFVQASVTEVRDWMFY